MEDAKEIKWIGKVENFTDRLTLALKGESVRSFARKAKVSEGALRQYVTGKSEPTRPVLIALAKTAGVRVEWLATGDGPLSIDEGTALGAEFVLIPQMSGEISAGGGRAPDNNIEMKVAFRRDWIARRGDPKNMSLIRVTGDSMEPTLYSGDLVLVDHSRDYFEPSGGIYALALDHEIMIKRVQVFPGKKRVKIISDNPRYEPMEAEPEQITVNGKVIWFGREIER